MGHKHKHLRTVADSDQTSQPFSVTLWKTKVQGQEISAITCPDRVSRWAFSSPTLRVTVVNVQVPMRSHYGCLGSATKKPIRSVLIVLSVIHYSGSVSSQLYRPKNTINITLFNLPLILYAGQWTNKEAQTDHSIMKKWQCDPFHPLIPPPFFILLFCFLSPVKSNLGSLPLSQHRLRCCAFAA
jgi:hypothetical protein